MTEKEKQFREVLRRAGKRSIISYGDFKHNYNTEKVTEVIYRTQRNGTWHEYLWMLLTD